MNRIGTLTLFLLTDFSRSLLVFVPPGITLALYRVFFLYGSDVPYFASVGAIILSLVCLATIILLTNNANRASTYALLARVPHRGELVAALALAALFVTVVMALFFTATVWLGRSVPLTPLDLLAIAPRWLICFLFITAFGLHLSKLISLRASNLFAYAILILTLVSYQRLEYPESGLLDSIQRLITTVLGPVTAALLEGSPSGLFVTFLYAIFLYSAAVWLFEHKDLLWAE